VCLFRYARPVRRESSTYLSLVQSTARQHQTKPDLTSSKPPISLRSSLTSPVAFGIAHCLPIYARAHVLTYPTPHQLLGSCPPCTSPNRHHIWTRPIANHHRQCRAMLRNTVRDETDHAHQLAFPTDALQSLLQDTPTAPQTSIEAVQMHLEARDHSLMEADLRSALAYLALAHLAAAMLDVAKFEN
jgi:hypothetical protein